VPLVLRREAHVVADAVALKISHVHAPQPQHAQHGHKGLVVQEQKVLLLGPCQALEVDEQKSQGDVGQWQHGGAQRQAAATGAAGPAAQDAATTARQHLQGVLHAPGVAFCFAASQRTKGAGIQNLQQPTARAVANPTPQPCAAAAADLTSGCCRRERCRPLLRSGGEVETGPDRASDCAQPH
jgi:hypothetical protein